MSSLPTTRTSLESSRVPSRREEYRQATIDAIKTLARRQLAEHGPGGLSLRAIAREMRTAPSAPYRYFASQEDLVGALCADAYDSLADAAEAALDPVPADDHPGRWWAICQALRGWSLAYPADFALIFGTPVPGYQAPARVTGPAAGRFTRTALTTYLDAVDAGAADPDRSHVPPDLPTGSLLDELLGENGSKNGSERDSGRAPRLANIVLSAYASVMGFLVTEVFGSLTQLTGDADRLYRAHVRMVMSGMGFDALPLEA